MSLTGIVLAAGAGTRYGGPKVLVPGWLDNAIAALESCDEVIVVLGAAIVETDATVVVAGDWESGMGHSLRAGLAAAVGADAVVVVTVDVPSLTAAMVSRLADGTSRTTLRQASFDGRPGHPVVIGAEHVEALEETLDGDVGARDYLRANGVQLVECGDLGSGVDVDE